MKKFLKKSSWACNWRCRNVTSMYFSILLRRMIKLVCFRDWKIVISSIDSKTIHFTSIIHCWFTAEMMILCWSRARSATLQTTKILLWHFLVFWYTQIFAVAEHICTSMLLPVILCFCVQKISQHLTMTLLQLENKSTSHFTSL